jgi:thioesterase domain-containing protein/acyl carrier protein
MDDAEKVQTAQYPEKRDPEKAPRAAETQKAQAEFWSAIQTVMGLQQGLPALKPVAAGAGGRLSYAEERLWTLNEYQPNTAALNIPFTLRLRGELQEVALEKSLTDLWNRHEILRTQYRQTQDGPIRIVNAPQPYPLPVHDLSRLPQADRAAKAMELAIQAAQEPFQLSEDPLLRVSLLRLETQEHWLLITLHHIVFDGWSEGILFRELSDLYRSHVAGTTPALPGLPIQYGDYGEWQRNSLVGNYRDALLGYWQQQLENGQDVQQMPIDQLRTPENKNRSAVETFQIAAPLSERLKAFSRQQKVTLFVTLLTAFNVLLYRYTDQERIYVCTPSANRTRTETKRLIGYFVNLLILQTDLRGNPSVVELVHRVRQVVSGAFAYQDLPLQVLLEEMNLGNAPTAQVMFALQNTPKQTPALLDLEIERLEIDNGFADFDLFLSIAEAGKELTGTLKYNAALYTDETIRRLLGHYRRILEGVVAHPESPLTSPQLLNVDIARRRPSPHRKMETAVSRQEYVPPRTETEHKLVEIWQAVLGIESVGVRDDFFQLGGQSLLAAKLFKRIKEEFGKNLPLSILFQAPAVEQLAEILEQQEAEKLSWATLVPVRRTGSRPPVFFVHGVGGNVLSPQTLLSHLREDQPFYALQSVGLDGSSPPLTSIEEMASRYIQEIQLIQPHGPYSFIGLSMGGSIAFEMAQQVYSQGQTMALLIMLDTYGSQYYGYDRPLAFKVWITRHITNLIRLRPKQKLAYVLSGIQSLKIRFFTKILQIRPLAKIVPRQWLLNDSISLAKKSTEFAQAPNMDVVRANYVALGKYKPQIYPGKITLFRVTQQPWWSIADRHLGWLGLARKGIEVCDIPGNHYTLLDTSNVEKVAQQINFCIEQSDAQAKSL